MTEYDNALPDLPASFNRVMAARGLAPFPAPEVASMVGDSLTPRERQTYTARPGQGA